MKKVLLGLMVLLITSTAYAQCVGEPLINQSKIGSLGEVLVPTRYTINEIEEPNIDWKTYQPEELAEMTQVEIKTKIESDISERCSQIIKRKYIKDNNNPLIEERKKIAPNQISRIGTLTIESVNKNKAIIILDKIGTVEINTDGKKTFTPIIDNSIINNE